MNEYLWHTPNLHPMDRNSDVWYTKGHLGKMPLGQFVPEICLKKVGTSKQNTNHCVSVIMDSGKFNDTKVMEVYSPHKYINV